ncbi:hypothetical protein J2W97_002572 [Paenibacillus jamilae]|jgi:hypothetical protein|nr:hypothetical protein [Paenibacillus jamilae]
MILLKEYNVLKNLMKTENYGRTYDYQYEHCGDSCK